MSDTHNQDATANETAFIAVDWGTSSLRGARLDVNGNALEERAFARGIMTVPPSEFASVFEALFGDWMSTQGTLCLISGMAGSRQGWVEAPYCACPAGFDELAGQLAWLPQGALNPKGHRIAIVPGMSSEEAGVPDVMRGEEVQIFGAMQLSGWQNGLFVLPGTHSKWAVVQDGRITSFKSFMTGEVFAALSQHTILAKTIATDAPFDEAAFARGVANAQGPSGLLHHAFSARTLSLFGRMQAGPLASYLSGLVIGEELRAQTIGPVAEVVLVGSPGLNQRYSLALHELGLRCQTFGSEATWRGLAALAAKVNA